MGTRSTYRIIEQWSDDETKKIESSEICLVYVQYDGYPSGHPVETAEWLSTGKVVNGIGLNETELIFNGAGCLAAQFIAKLKTGVGNVYMHSLESRGKCSEDYLYDIVVRPDRSIEYICFENYGDEPEEIFRGTPADFVNTFAKVEQ